MRRNRGRRGGSGDFWALFSFIIVLLLGLALVLSFVFFWIPGVSAFAGWIEHIAIAAALIIPLILSYREARVRGTVWFVLWVIAVVLIVVFYILLRVGPFAGWW